MAGKAKAAKKRLLVVGGGNMGGAMIRGLSKKNGGSGQLQVEVVERDPEVARVFLEHGATVHKSLSVPGLFKGLDSMAICIKPRDLEGFAAEVRRLGGLSRDTLVLSVLAGTSIQQLSVLLTFAGTIVRAMPNLPATVSESATALCVSEGQASSGHKALAERIFSSMGRYWWLEEEHFDAVTGLSGSGPAFVFVMMDAMVDAGVKVGLPRATARALTMQTFYGSAALAQTAGEHPIALKDRVTTPAGTAIHGVEQLELKGFRAAVIKAVEAATKRSAELRPKVDPNL